MNPDVEHIKESPFEYLMVRKVNVESTNIIVYSDASFAGNKDASSHEGYMILLADKTGTENLM